jgi:signal transduction histidine kinase
MMQVRAGLAEAQAFSASRVLVVDDDADFADSLVEVLEDHGFHAVIAHDGASALERTGAFEPHVALIDLRLGVEDGTALIDRMRLQRPDMVCIMMTAYAALDNAVQALRNRADDYLLKPLDPERVIQVIHNALRHARELALAERRERLASVGALAAGVAHDLNNVLTIMIGETELMDRALPAGSEAVRAGLQSMRASTMRAAQITRSLLLIARGEPGSTPCANPRDVLRELAATLQRSLPPHIELLCDLALDSDLPLALGASQLYQVVLNLLVNARDAIRGSGRVVMRSRASPPPAASGKLGPTTPEPRAGLLITVADNGSGIDPLTMQRLFEPFFTTKTHGSGLGLATAYSLVSTCGGEMWVESKLEIGTEFTVWIPRFEPSPSLRVSGVVASARPQRVMSVGPAGELPAVLLCDDDPMILHALGRVLRDMGHEVTSASEVGEAWELWQRRAERFALVLTDMRLGKEPGLELARRILADRADTHVVLMSGDSPAVDALDPIWTQVTYLQKPFNRAALCAAIGCEHHGLR